MAEIVNKSVYMKKFDKFLKTGKYRKTPERYKVLDIVLSFNKHFSIDDIKTKLNDENYYLSVATIYNTLKLFLAAEIIKTLDFEGVNTQYVVIGVTSNVHLICTSCNKIKDVRDTNFITFMNTRKYTAFKTCHYSLFVYGICSTCARKQNKTKNLKNKNKNQ